MIRVYLKNGVAIDFPTTADVEGTYFPAPVGADGRHALEVLDADGALLGCFQPGEVAGYVAGRLDRPERS